MKNPHATAQSKLANLQDRLRANTITDHGAVLSLVGILRELIIETTKPRPKPATFHDILCEYPEPIAELRVRDEKK
jgi:hypothetical protein